MIFAPVDASLFQHRLSSSCLLVNDHYALIELKTRAFEDKQGIKRNVTEIIGEQVLMLDKKES